MKCWRSMLPLPAKTALGLRLTAQITMPSARTVPSESGGRLWLAQPWRTAKVETVEFSDRHLPRASLYTARPSAPAVATTKFVVTKQEHPAPGNPHPAEHMHLNFMSTNFRPSATQWGGFPSTVRTPWQNLGPTPLSCLYKPVWKLSLLTRMRLFWNMAHKGCSDKIQTCQSRSHWYKLQTHHQINSKLNDNPNCIFLANTFSIQVS